ncbi:MAG: hypothetical protein LBG19_12250 [Prevotellaceae bacterium]|jgi:hypothetical protein|nr:hypothetical protein [Prevotellaceae bacterium]
MKKFILPALFTFAMATSLLVTTNKNEGNDISLKNVMMPQSSASEAKCDASNTNQCVIYGIGEGTGALIFG